MQFINAYVLVFSYRVNYKPCAPPHVGQNTARHTSVKSKPIFKILPLQDSAVNLQ